MKITFNTQTTPEIEKQYMDKPKMEKQGKADNAHRAAFFMGGEDTWLPGSQGTKEKGKNLVELQQEAGNIDVGNRRDYMTVMSNTMSEEDYAKLEEEGFDMSSMNPEEAVTILDKIKAELAKSGEYIVGYTDDLDVDTLAAAVGSETLARSIAESFQAADIPLTQENITNVKRAWDMASQLETPSEGATHYMIDNGMEPEIWDFYLAQNSGAESMTTGRPRYYAENVQGYFTRSAGNAASMGMNGNQSAQPLPQGLQEQMDKVIAEAGLPLNVETTRDAAWLVEKGLPLTEENLLRMQELKSVSFPVEEALFAKAVAVAVTEGKKPLHANLKQTENVYTQAAALMESFWAGKEAVLKSDDVTARRQLEEIRLRLTAEVNVKLLKSGFAIDTAPMEELLEVLKKVETELAESYFPKDAQALSKYELFRQTGQVVEELPKLPAQVLGNWSIREADGTVAQFHQEGKILQETYEKAQESYEALMTAPRSDMGDSIRKAFANVDAILEDLKLATSEENQRAVRILGYNRMEMTVENIERVRETDAQVQYIVSKMTPAATLKMIRDGQNPLEMSFGELENYFNQNAATYEESAESYSRFLYHLEQNKEITSEERDAYIGIYRMLRQIKKTDGAAVGAIVNTGAELQFANLLSAVRSRHFHHMDVKVTDETGLMQELVREGSSISEQITGGIASVIQQAEQIMTGVSSNEEAAAGYRKLEMELLREAAQVSQESYSFLNQNGVSVTPDNLLAAQDMVQNLTNPYKKWKEKVKELGMEETAAPNMELLENLTDIEDVDAFRESYSNLIQEMSEQVETATLEKAESAVDVRALQMVHKQLSIATAMSDSQEFILPMYIGEELGRVHLSLVKDETEKGNVVIRVNYGENSRVEAHLQVNAQLVSGYLVGNTEEEVMKLEKTADIFHELLSEDTVTGWQCTELPVVSGGNNAHSSITGNETVRSSDTAALYRVARMFLQAIR